MDRVKFSKMLKFRKKVKLTTPSEIDNTKINVNATFKVKNGDMASQKKICDRKASCRFITKTKD